MRVEQVSSDQMSEYLARMPKAYFLFESAQLEEADYDHRLAQSNHELPIKKTARDLVNEIDPYTIDTLLWEDTVFNEFKYSGPIVCQYHQGSKIPEAMFAMWGNWNLGLLIDAVSKKSLIQHLRSLLMVQMPQDGEVRYRLQETRKLAGIINSLCDEDRVSEFLGPIKSICWQQNCGPEKTFMRVINPSAHETHNSTGWFSFSEEEKKRIQASSLAWFKRSILNSILKDIETDNSKTHRLNKFTPKQLEQIIEKGYAAALLNKISSQLGVTFFVRAHMLHPEFMTDLVTKQILTHESWSEKRKIHALKAMLKSHLEQAHVDTC